MNSYNKFTNDCYPCFVSSDDWEKGIEQISGISLIIADAINEYGIGETITQDGQYDFESGQLLDNLPEEIRKSDEMETVYN